MNKEQSGNKANEIANLAFDYAFKGALPEATKASIVERAKRFLHDAMEELEKMKGKG